MIEAKAGSQVQILNFAGHPICKARLLGVCWNPVHNHWLYVVRPLESRNGYDAGEEDTARRVMPCAAIRWIDKGMTFAPKPYRIAANLPTV